MKFGTIVRVPCLPPPLTRNEVTVRYFLFLRAVASILFLSTRKYEPPALEDRRDGLALPPSLSLEGLPP